MRWRPMKRTCCRTRSRAPGATGQKLPVSSAQPSASSITRCESSASTGSGSRPEIPVSRVPCRTGRPQLSADCNSVTASFPRALISGVIPLRISVAFALPYGNAGSCGSMHMRAGRNILIVEDDENTLAGWVELLRAAGYLVTGVSSYEEGRQELAAMPDLLITDVRLGVYNGLQLIMRGRMGNPHLQGIVITGYADSIVRREAVYLQAEHLEKPVDADRLLQVVGNALRSPAAALRVN